MCVCVLWGGLGLLWGFYLPVRCKQPALEASFTPPYLRWGMRLLRKRTEPMGISQVTQLLASSRQSTPRRAQASSMSISTYLGWLGGFDMCMCVVNE